MILHQELASTVIQLPTMTLIYRERLLRTARVPPCHSYPPVPELLLWEDF